MHIRVRQRMLRLAWIGLIGGALLPIFPFAQSEEFRLLGLACWLAFVGFAGWIVLTERSDDATGGRIGFGYFLAFSTIAPGLYLGVTSREQRFASSALGNGIVLLLVILNLVWSLLSIVMSQRSDRVLACLSAPFHLGLTVFCWFFATMAVNGNWL